MFGVVNSNDGDYTGDLTKTIILNDSFMMAVSVSAVSLRLLARRVARQTLFVDDWLILLAALFSWSACIISILGTQLGAYGRHLVVATLSRLEYTLKNLFAYEACWATSIMFAKLSILCFYRRIFSIPQTKIPAYILGFVVVAWTIGAILNMIFMCIPINKFWDKTAPGKCLDMLQQLLIFAVANLVIDIALIIFPLPLIWGTQMPSSRKVAFSAFFMVGLLVVIIAGLRIVPNVQALGQFDSLWYLIPIDIFSQVELNVAILCACLPSFAPLFGGLKRKQAVQATTMSVLAARNRFFERRRVVRSQVLGTSATAMAGAESQDSDTTARGSCSPHKLSLVNDTRMSENWLDLQESGSDEWSRASRR